jgi:hypothetical protein
LCAEGVLYAEKDFNLEKHPEIEVPNLQVIKLMQSFKSKEYVTERFAWRHYYWCVPPASHPSLLQALLPAPKPAPTVVPSASLVSQPESHLHSHPSQDP